MKHESRAYHYRVVNRPLTSIDINRDPAVLFDDAEKTQNILARVEQPKNTDTEDSNNIPSWNIIFPINQNVREGDADTTHVMIAPRGQDFVTIQDMSEEQLRVGTRVICRFLRQERAIAGYNTSNDDRTRKEHSQSWNNFHAHLLRLPVAPELPQIPTPKTMKEPGYWHIGEVVTRYAAQHISPDEALPHHGERQQDMMAGPGTAIFTLPDISPEKLSAFMLKMDAVYRAFHRDIFDVFVTNYDQVAQSEWKAPYVVRTREDIKERLPIDQPWLQHVARVVRDDAPSLPADKKIYRSPSYSVGMYVKDQALHFALQPHFLRATG